jgi:hypothetical protein
LKVIKFAEENGKHAAAKFFNVAYKWKHVIESFTGFTLKCHQLLPGIEMKV